MKRIILTGFLFLFLPTAFARASVVFTEVNYDPQGTDSKHEWVEVYNNGNDSIDLTKYFLQTDGASSSFHTINSVAGVSNLPGNTYAVIASDAPTFLADYSGYGGIVYDSSWNDLSDTSGKTLVINDANKTILNQFTYDVSLGGSNGGNSLQKTSGDTWISALPTPGIGTLEDDSSDSNSNTQDNNTNDSNDGSSNETNSGTASSTSNFVSNTPQAQLSIPKNIIAGVPVKITPSLINVSSPTYNQKSFYISLGDGSQHYDYTASAFWHSYTFPGMYVVYFEYVQNPYNPDSGDILSIRKTIEVLPSPIVINNINVDGSVEISNPSSRDVDMSQWILRSLVSPDMYFTIPKNTIILPGKKILFSSDVTGLSYENLKSLELSLPSGTAIAVYDGNKNTNSAYTIPLDSDTNIQANIDKPVAKKIVADYSTTITQKDLDTQTVPDNSNIDLEAQALPLAQSNKSSSPIIPLTAGGVGIIIVSVFILKSLHTPSVDIENQSIDNENISTKKIADKIRIIEE